jgi:hypothetical protein
MIGLLTCFYKTAPQVQPRWECQVRQLDNISSCLFVFPVCKAFPESTEREIAILAVGVAKVLRSG